ncbi:MAG: hypothetical protein BWZ10_02218 [candidate division BRC1 bacterium ADurb.BinA364]|nr:MAG: hypothetical protein BWZ10_02218 [candidate division BRC1 bacterium ADurb.BinA364]
MPHGAALGPADAGLDRLGDGGVAIGAYSRSVGRNVRRDGRHRESGGPAASGGGNQRNPGLPNHAAHRPELVRVRGHGAARFEKHQRQLHRLARRRRKGIAGAAPVLRNSFSRPDRRDRRAEGVSGRSAADADARGAHLRRGGAGQDAPDPRSLERDGPAASSRLVGSVARGRRRAAVSRLALAARRNRAGAAPRRPRCRRRHRSVSAHAAAWRGRQSAAAGLSVRLARGDRGPARHSARAHSEKSVRAAPAAASGRRAGPCRGRRFSVVRSADSRFPAPDDGLAARKRRIHSPFAGRRVSQCERTADRAQSRRPGAFARSARRRGARGAARCPDSGAGFPARIAQTDSGQGGGKSAFPRRNDAGDRTGDARGGRAQFPCAQEPNRRTDPRHVARTDSVQNRPPGRPHPPDAAMRLAAGRRFRFQPDRNVRHHPRRPGRPAAISAGAALSRGAPRAP